MAEAVVDTPQLSRFFCHECSCEIENLLPDYKCPLCSGGFIEELENTSYNMDSSLDVSTDELNFFDMDTGSSEETSEGGLRSGGTSTSQSGTSRRGCTRHSQPRNSTQSRYATSPYVVGRRTRRINNRPRGQQNSQAALDNFVQDLILNFTGQLSSMNVDFPPFQAGASPSLLNFGLFLGNPGDYVWGRDGLDAIVTQLLNQMDGTGPPPLPKRQIEEIPTTSVTQLQVDSKLQCSVCWEDFLLAEPVKQLLCLHIYHTSCIVPWLQLHGTCPICRQSLGDQSSAEANEDTVGSSLAALFRAVSNTENQDQNSQETDSAASNTRSQSSNSAGNAAGSSRTNSSNEI